MNLEVRIAKQGYGDYRAWCPALPGCAVCGRDLQEVRQRARAAVHGYLASLDVALPRELGRLSVLAWEGPAARAST